MKNTISIKKNYEFYRVYKKGVYKAGRYLVVYLLKNRTSSNRLGISIGKKVGNSVQRSRVMRLVKENYRLLEDELKQGFDIVITVRPLPRAAKTPNNKMKAVCLPSYDEIRKEINRLFLKLELLQDRDE